MSKTTKKAPIEPTKEKVATPTVPTPELPQEQPKVEGEEPEQPKVEESIEQEAPFGESVPVPQEDMPSLDEIKAKERALRKR